MLRLDRRGFLRAMGLSAAAFSAACKRGPAEKAVPLASRAAAAPGGAVWYATTCGACSAGCGLLAKTRDARPIKLEGNPDHPTSRGGVCALGQASVLSLYDRDRARGPAMSGRAVTWEALDAHVRSQLARLTQEGKAIRLVVPPAIGPTAEAAVARFVAAYPTARVVRHEPAGERLSIAAAHAATHGLRAVPWYRFDKARVIASFGADFLGTWLSPVAFTSQRSINRGARHVQFEPHVSLTGSSADERVAIRPSQMIPALAGLCSRLLSARGQPAPELLTRFPEVPFASALERAAASLWEARGQCLVVCGSDDPAAQALANYANELLEAYGATVELASTHPEAAGLTTSELLSELESGHVAAAIFVGTNPAYEHPQGERIAQLLGSLELAVSTADRDDETAHAAGILAPDHHFIESWGDAISAPGVLAVRQPVVSPLWRTRHAFESLLRWSGAQVGFRELLAERWEREVYPRAREAAGCFESFWDRSLHDGFALVPAESAKPAFALDGLERLLRPAPARATALELALYQSVALRDGAAANNAWLQELPDPVAGTAWGHHAALSPARATALGVRDGDNVALNVEGRSITLPTRVVPGVHDEIIAVAVGYGRSRAGEIGNGVGANAWRLAGGRTFEGQPLVANRAPGDARMALSPELGIAAGPASRPSARAALRPASFEPAPERERRWGLLIDLDACTGCGACVVSCQAENNIPAVGPEESRRGRTMHWLRLEPRLGADGRASRQPMLCMHCASAPCESACPVLASVHSPEGLSEQIYARCTGTRYCAAACPIKARRFNWIDHERDPVERLVLNPDLVVRGRGVMEKCSLCAHRIEEARAKARAEGRDVADGELATACQQSCPAQAIYFGDLLDPRSRISLATKGREVLVLVPRLDLDPAVRFLARRGGGSRRG